MATERRRTSARDETYADNAMTWLLGDHPKARMLTVFVGKDYRDLTAEQVCDLAGVQGAAFENYVGDLLDFGVVEVSESSDPCTYRLNSDSEVAADLAELQLDLIEVVGER